MSRSRLTSTGLLVVADAGLLAALWPDVPASVRGFAAPRRWFVEAGTDHVLAVLAGVGLWCVAAWVAVGLFAALLGRLPGATGAAASRFARRALPAALRRIVIGSAGLGVLLTPIAPLAAGAQSPDGPGGRPTTAASQQPDPLPGPSWPGSGSASAPPSSPPPTPTPSSTPVPPGPRWPGSSTPHRVPPTVPKPTRTPTPTRPTVPRSSRPVPAPTPPPPSTGRATVRAGDCLWLIAARRVGPAADDVAAYLPELYAANRDVIGDDPDLVRPGQVLVLPGPSAEE